MSSNNHDVESQKDGFVLHSSSKRDQISSSVDTNLAVSGWENAPQPWNERACKKWIPWRYIIQHWPEVRQKKLMKGFYVPLGYCKHDEYKTNLTCKWKLLSKNERATKCKRFMVPYWLAAMVYAEVFLNRNVDWNLVNERHKNSNVIQNYSNETTETSLSTHIDKLKKENEFLESEVSKLNDNLTKNEGEIKMLSATIENLKGYINKIEDEFHNSKSVLQMPSKDFETTRSADQLKIQTLKEELEKIKCPNR